ncbi:MAG: nitroreductase family deazaflavin-dependent oxidoreductase [Thermoleophilia bacterium]
MAYLKPPFLVRRVFNPLAMRFGIGGAQTLSVPRRRSGGEQRVPVIAVDVDGARYVVSTRGETEWVRNVRAAGTLSLGSAGSSRRYSVTEVPVDRRAPIIDAYRKKAGRTVDAYWKQLPDPSDHPTFELTPA